MKQLQIFNYAQTTYDVKDFSRYQGDSHRLDVTFFARLTSKSAFVKRLKAIEPCHNYASDTYMRERVSEGAGRVEPYITDDSIYVVLINEIIGKYLSNGTWQSQNPPIKLPPMSIAGKLIANFYETEEKSQIPKDKQTQKRKELAMFFYQRLGYRIVEDDEQEKALYDTVQELINTRELKELKIRDGDTEISIKHPIVIIGKAIKVSSHQLGLRGYKKKRPEFVLGKTAWYTMEELSNKDLAFVRALDGKKVKLTIEVIEG